MEFLKSVSDILDKFTKGQRMFALAMILICATVITMGPSLVESITLNEEETDRKISDQKREIINLSSSVDSLSTIIRVNQMNCTNSILERESQFIAMLDQLKSESIKRETVKKLTTESYQMTDSLQIGGEGPIKLENRKIKVPNYEPLSNLIDCMKQEIRGKD